MPAEVKKEQAYAKGPYYADWPSCLSRYSWMVKDAIRSNDLYRVFNDNRSIYNKTYDAICRVCGGQASMRDLKDHVNEHAIQLGIIEGEIKMPTASKRKTAADLAGKTELSAQDVAGLEVLLGEISDQLAESVADRSGEVGSLVFTADDQKLADIVASDIVSLAAEADSGEPALCDDCSNY